MSNPSDYIEVGSESGEEEEIEQEAEDSEEQEGFIPVMDSPRVFPDKEGEGTLFSSAGEGDENSQGNQWNRGDIDGLFCPICLEAWTTAVDHHVCCLPCGHIFGLSCIQKWLQQSRTSKKCPQCNGKCTLKDVRKLFASRIVAIDGEAQKAHTIILEFNILKLSIAVSNTSSSPNEPKVESEPIWTDAQAVTQLQELLQSVKNIEKGVAKAKTEILALLEDLQGSS